MTHPRFRSVVLDVDSTLSGIEGIDWLAAQRGAEVEARVARLTELAMSGELTLDEVFERRLLEVKPSRTDIERLAEAYVAMVAPGALESLEAMQRAGVRVVIVSGGILEAIVPLASALGVPRENLHAVSIQFTDDGDYLDFDRTSTLSRQRGKRTVAEALELIGPVVAVGDGITDAEMRPAVDCFVAFTGFVTRPTVVNNADRAIATFGELQELVLG